VDDVKTLLELKANPNICNNKKSGTAETALEFVCGTAPNLDGSSSHDNMHN
jgi:hypothetical protein